MKKRIEKRSFEGERPLFQCQDATLESCVFLEGESALKEGKRLALSSCRFTWKYPLWYGKGLRVEDCLFEENARAAFWYDEEVVVKNLVSRAPKGFRKIRGLTLEGAEFENGDETFWQVEDFSLSDVLSRSGQYFMMQCKRGKIARLALQGDYIFDGVEDLLVEDADIRGKDAFWNSKNVTLKRCRLRGQYLAWNAKNLTLIDCDVSSLQGLCYIDGLKMVNCTLGDSDLCFEYCQNVDADISGHVVSIKNPISGRIRAESVGQLLFDDPKIDPTRTEIVVG